MKIQSLLILIALFCLNMLANALPAPPTGFKWVSVYDDDTALLQPDGWIFKKVQYNPHATGVFITKEPMETTGVINIGLSLNIAEQVKRQTRKTPSEYARQYLDKQARQGTALDTFSREIGALKNIGGRFLIQDERGESIHHFYLIADDVKDALFIYQFAAPKDQWDAAWEIGSIILTGLDLRYEMLMKQQDILEILRLANRHFMEKWEDPGDDIVHEKSRPSNIWTRSVYYEGLMEYYTIDPDPVILEYAEEWGESHHWGLHGGTRVRNADYHACGSTYLALYEIKAEGKRIRDIQESIDYMLDKDIIDDWDWIDALFMGMPVFARLYVLTENPAYAERMYAMYMDTKVRQGLWNPADHLWWRDADFLPPYAEPNGEDCYWSRGNGWVVAAMARVLQILPKDAPHYEEYQHMLLQMLDALMSLQREDGFWNVSLHDPEHFGGKETSGTALFTYAMAWAVNHGLVDAAVYEPAVWKAWNAMVNDALHPDGSLGYVQSTGKEPASGQPVTYERIANFEDYGLGCFLLAGTEVYRLLQ